MRSAAWHDSFDRTWANRLVERDRFLTPGDHRHTTRRPAAHTGAWLGAAALAVAALATAGMALAGRVEVRGASMLPTLDEGDRLLVRRVRRVRPGQLVVVRDPEVPDRLLVKRVAAVAAGRVELAGDNPAASRDSRSFGSVDHAEVMGVAWYRYQPARFAGRLRPTGR